MKYLDGKEVLRGDAVIAPVDNGKSVVCGTVHEIYERVEKVRITGYALMVDAKDCVLAQEAFNAYAGPLLKARKEAEASEKAKASAPAQSAPEAPPAT